MTQQIDPYYNKNYICPFCETAFKTTKIRSRFSNPYQIDSDFCPHFKEDDLNPLFYFVTICPQCGFSFSDQFSETLKPDSKEVVWENFSRSWNQLDYTHKRNRKQALDSYKLAIYCGDLINEKPEVLAGLSLRLAWLYRSESNEENEARFMRLSLTKYEKSYMEKDSFDESMSEMKILFIIGELCRRLGKFSEAVKYFTKVIQHPNRLNETNLVRQAREQWILMREQNRTERELPE
jgi:uncharacterized protein (DUF2225 family)